MKVLGVILLVILFYDNYNKYICEFIYSTYIQNRGILNSQFIKHNLKINAANL